MNTNSRFGRDIKDFVSVFVIFNATVDFSLRSLRRLVRVGKIA